MLVCHTSGLCPWPSESGCDLRWLHSALVARGRLGCPEAVLTVQPKGWVWLARVKSCVACPCYFCIQRSHLLWFGKSVRAGCCAVPAAATPTQMPCFFPQVPDNFLPPVPITAPIMNPLADPQAQMQQPSAPAPPSSAPSFQPPHLPAGQMVLQGGFQPASQPLGPSIMPPTVSKPSTEGAPGAPIGNAIQVT